MSSYNRNRGYFVKLYDVKYRWPDTPRDTWYAGVIACTNVYESELAIKLFDINDDDILIYINVDKPNDTISPEYVKRNYDGLEFKVEHEGKEEWRIPEDGDDGYDIIYDYFAEKIPDSVDAAFLPGNIHGCDYQVYILYANYDSSQPSWEIEIIDKDQLLEADRVSKGNIERFFDILPDICQGDWGYAHMAESDLHKWYDKADYIGGGEGLYKFLMDFANS